MTPENFPLLNEMERKVNWRATFTLRDANLLRDKNEKVAVFAPQATLARLGGVFDRRARALNAVIGVEMRAVVCASRALNSALQWRRQSTEGG